MDLTEDMRIQASCIGLIRDVFDKIESELNEKNLSTIKTEEIRKIFVSALIIENDNCIWREGIELDFSEEFLNKYGSSPIEFNMTHISEFIERRVYDIDNFLGIMSDVKHHFNKGTDCVMSILTICHYEAMQNKSNK